MKKIIICISIAFLGLLPGLTVTAQQTEQKFVQELKYLLYLPDNYVNDTMQRWPLVLFLHGSGESGTDIQKVKVHGPPKLVEQGKKFPFILISPQATEGWKPAQLIGLIRDIKKKYRIDNDRVYAAGLSMGGFGSWALATEYPDEFAAIAPICGGGDSSKAWIMRKVAVWCFHGAKDNVVPLTSSEKMVNALKRYNPSVRFTVYPEANHDSWTETYNNEEFYQWLLAQKKFRYKQTTIRPALLNQYAGTYLRDNKDTITLTVKGNVLETILPGNRVMEVKPASDNLFFFDENAPEDIRFTRNAAGKVDGLEVWGRERVRLKRIAIKKN